MNNVQTSFKILTETIKKILKTGNHQTFNINVVSKIHVWNIKSSTTFLGEPNWKSKRMSFQNESLQLVCGKKNQW